MFLRIHPLGVTNMYCNYNAAVFFLYICAALKYITFNVQQGNHSDVSLNSVSLKWTIAPVKVWQKAVCLERAKIGEEPLNKTGLLRDNRLKMHYICGGMVGNRPRGLHFLLAEDTVGNATIRSSLLFGHFPKCNYYALNLAQKGLQFSLGLFQRAPGTF